ncbi:hypothetical protein [Anabaena sp. CCY 9402-a]|uniref:hypothetical protein n=1 Tax=Anabaena sp. CCY 9402-a TaxID=3103867 RepID=UPI0039C71725
MRGNLDTGILIGGGDGDRSSGKRGNLESCDRTVGDAREFMYVQGDMNKDKNTT